MLKKISELNLGFSDAQNYLQRGNKKMFSSVFVKNSYLEDLLQPHIYFLLGEKGTGKTAYATFLSNSEYKNNKSILKYINGTDYEKFYELKKSKRIDISGYVDIWKTIILLLISKSIAEEDRVISLFNKSNLGNLLDAIDEYYNKAFSPEIINALKIVDKSEVAAKLVCQHAEIGGNAGTTLEFNEQRLQMNLYYICQKFSECLGTLKLNKNIILFIDGIDVRPSQIPYEEFLFKIDRNVLFFELTDVFQAVQRIAGKPADGLGDNHVDVPGHAFVNHAVELRALFRIGAGDAPHARHLPLAFL